MNAKALAERKAARQLRHRAKTGGLEPRAHVKHEREVVDSRTYTLKRSDALLAALAKLSGRNARFEMISDSILDPATGERIDLLDEAAPWSDSEHDVAADLHAAFDGMEGADTSLDCPRCGAVGLDPCRKPNGRVADKAHAGRVTS